MLALQILSFLSCFTAIVLNGVDDWPHWRGPQRNDQSAETGLLKQWPAEGPVQLWVYDQGGLGYAGFAVVADRLFSMGLEEETEFAFCLDATTGQKIWQQPLSGTFREKHGDGPRSTPSIDGERAYFLTSTGTLACLNHQSGEILWKVQLTDFGGVLPQWGYAESPLVDDQQVVCTPGGDQGTFLALDKMTGEKIWQSECVTREVNGEPSAPARAHYSSILPIVWNDQKQYVQLTPLAVISIDPQTGSEIWRSDWPGRIAVIPSPIFDNGQVYITSGYDIGSKLIQLDSANQASDLWFNKVMVNHHGGVILVDDHFYGSSEQIFVCQDRQTGERKWGTRQMKKGSTLYAEGLFYHLQEADGRLLLFAADSEGPDLKGFFRISPQSERRTSQGKIWVHPVISNGRLFVRDQELILCYDIRER